jgi:hypothetical protein
MAAETIPVHYQEGLVHGFLSLSTLDGEPLAEGDLTQVAHGGRVTNHLVFRFRDGSVHDETAVFTQRGNFQLVSDHLIQKGPTFPHPIDVSIDVAKGQVMARYSEADGKEKVLSEHVSLPADVANGMVFTLLKNIKPATPAQVSMVAATPKPRIVKLLIDSNGEEDFSVGRAKHKAVHYVIKVHIGGVVGLVAPVIGKQPADTHVWVLRDQAPAFVKSEGPLFEGGPVWRIELVSPTWPK